MMDVDHVTGLASRADLHRFFIASPNAIAVLICDVVGLKAINERDGFLAGDATLRRGADRLRQAANGATMVARLGGDELVAIFAGPRAQVQAEAAAAAIEGPGTPAMRAAAVAGTPHEAAGSIIERAYAAMRRS